MFKIVLSFFFFLHIFAIHCVMSLRGCKGKTKDQEKWGTRQFMKGLPLKYTKILMATSFLSITGYNKNTFTNVSDAENQTNLITSI